MKVVRHDVIDSTNEEARRLAEAGETGPLWIVAAEQTAGRGRRGRVWTSQKGNLFATLLVTPAGTLEERARLSFVAGLAAADALAPFLEGAQLKWPNDVLLGGNKVVGILLESLGAAVAVGLGINLATFPSETEFPATSVAAETGAAPAPDAMLPFLAAAWDAWYEVWRHDGFAPVRAAWLARAAGVGEPIRVRLVDGEMHGVFEDLDEDGALMLRRGDGSLVRVTAGDVFFGG